MLPKIQDKSKLYWAIHKSKIKIIYNSEFLINILFKDPKICVFEYRKIRGHIPGHIPGQVKKIQNS